MWASPHPFKAPSADGYFCATSAKVIVPAATPSWESDIISSTVSAESSRVPSGWRGRPSRQKSFRCCEGTLPPIQLRLGIGLELSTPGAAANPSRPNDNAPTSSTDRRLSPTDLTIKIVQRGPAEYVPSADRRLDPSLVLLSRNSLTRPTWGT